MKKFKIEIYGNIFIREADSEEKAKQNIMKEFCLHWSEITCINQLK